MSKLAATWGEFKKVLSWYNALESLNDGISDDIEDAMVAIDLDAVD